MLINTVEESQQKQCELSVMVPEQNHEALNYGM
jgi:hypothetical protein